MNTLEEDDERILNIHHLQWNQNNAYKSNQTNNKVNKDTNEGVIKKGNEFEYLKKHSETRQSMKTQWKWTKKEGKTNIHDNQASKRSDNDGILSRSDMQN